jgi:hypothetical protein
MATKSTKPKTIGAIIDSMFVLREQKRGLEAQVKVIDAAIGEEELALMELMESQGLEKGTGKMASVSISTTTSFSFDPVEGFEKFMGYVAKHKYFHLVQRRISEVAVREVFESKGKVPGLVPFEKKKINLRTLPQ